jgi:translation initiation factor 2B subunit (eIF-2B alpha/beta/delta family)
MKVEMSVNEAIRFVLGVVRNIDTTGLDNEFSIEELVSQYRKFSKEMEVVKEELQNKGFNKEDVEDIIVVALLTELSTLSIIDNEIKNFNKLYKMAEKRYNYLILKEQLGW